ncbi:hypothetical protein V2J09_020372 [Rumex salicifolius]
MGSGFSHLIPCFKPEQAAALDDPSAVFTADQPLDETLGHSFCYVRSSSRFLSPSPSDRFVSPTQSLRFSPSHERSDPKPSRSAFPETGFRTISGASVSANSSTPRTVLQLDGVYDDATDSIVHGFESTSLFSSLPLQPVPRGEQSGPIDRGGFFLSGPIERGALSGPLDASSGGGDAAGVPFSAPLGPGSGLYPKRRRKKSFSAIKKAFQRSFSEKNRPWVVPVRNFARRKEASDGGGAAASMVDNDSERNVQWALGKAGEDRVHVVVSEENGWLFVGIYDGFNGPDAPEFLMSHLYRAVYSELKGLFWDSKDSGNSSTSNHQPVDGQTSVNIESCSVTEPAVEQLNPSVSREICDDGKAHGELSRDNQSTSAELDGGSVKKVTFQSEKRECRRKLWEFLAEDDAEDGLDLSGSERFAFSVDDALRVSNAGSAVCRRSLLLSRLKQGLSRSKDAQNKGLFTWRFGTEGKEKNEAVNRVEERIPRSCRKRKPGPTDHELVLRALSQALEKAELAYLDLTDRVINQYPELALMGSCLLVVLMRDEDVYVMNLGDSRAIVAQLETPENVINMDLKVNDDIGPNTEGIVEESGDTSNTVAKDAPDQLRKLTALQLSTDHSTSIEEEVLRINREHPDDNYCIVNDRVKGRLKVTRAFGAGFLKQAKFNDSLLEMFRNEFIGSAPYVSCIPSLCHYKLASRDQFLILSSDGLYQYLSNQEVVAHVASFMENNQDGDPAQHLIEELLSRAAKKAGMDFHDLLDIPQGDRRKYHDDVTVMVVSLEGRIWKSSGKYP